MNYDNIIKGIGHGLIGAVMFSFPIAKAYQIYITPTRPALVQPVKEGPKRLAAKSAQHQQYIDAIRHNLIAHYQEPFTDIDAMRVSWECLDVTMGMEPFLLNERQKHLARYVCPAK